VSGDIRNLPYDELFTMSSFPEDLLLICKGSSSSNIFFAYNNDVTTNWSPFYTMGNNNSTSMCLSSSIYDQKVFIAYKGNNTNNIYGAWSAGTSWSFPFILHQSIKTSQSPGLSEYYGKLYVAFKGESSDLIYWSSSPTGLSNWSQPVTLDNNARTWGAVNLINYDGKLYEFHRNGNALEYSTRTGSWSPVSIINIGFWPHEPSAVVFNDELFVFFFRRIHGSNDGTLHYVKTINGVFSSVIHTVANTKTAMRVGATVHDGKLILAMRGFSSHNLFTRYSFDGINWHSGPSPNGSTSRGPTLENIADLN
jgi:hypothetical protein